MAIEYRLKEIKSGKYLGVMYSYNNPDVSMKQHYFCTEDKSESLVFWEKSWAERFLLTHPYKNNFIIEKYDDPSYDWD